MKPLSRLEPLNDNQLAQVASWLEIHSYKKVGELALEHFGIEIPRMTLSRFRTRLTVKQVLDDSPESAQVSSEIVRYAATGQDNFSPATMIVLERTLFNLSFTCTRADEDMTALEKISRLLCRHRNTDVRERLAAVQERKCGLRERELSLKAKPQIPAESAGGEPAFASAAAA